MIGLLRGTIGNAKQNNLENEKTKEDPASLVTIFFFFLAMITITLDMGYNIASLFSALVLFGYSYNYEKKIPLFKKTVVTILGVISLLASMGILQSFIEEAKPMSYFELYPTYEYGLRLEDLPKRYSVISINNRSLPYNNLIEKGHIVLFSNGTTIIKNVVLLFNSTNESLKVFNNQENRVMQVLNNITFEVEKTKISGIGDKSIIFMIKENDTNSYNCIFLKDKFIVILGFKEKKNTENFKTLVKYAKIVEKRIQAHLV